jgi:hypothetical protein
MPKENRCKYTNMTTAPNFHATIKLQKQNTPITLVISWRDAPAYELAKHLMKSLRNSLHLPHAYNIDNSIHLIYYLCKIIKIWECVHSTQKICTLSLSMDL